MGVIPKRLRPDQLPGSPTHLRPFVPSFRVVRDFLYDGRVFKEGTLLSLESELARAIFAEHPEYLQPTS